MAPAPLSMWLAQQKTDTLLVVLSTDCVLQQILKQVGVNDLATSQAYTVLVAQQGQNIAGLHVNDIGGESLVRHNHPDGNIEWYGYGPNAEEILSGASVTSYDADSPWSRAAERDAAVLLIGENAPALILPWIEEMIGVPYRFWIKEEARPNDASELPRRIRFTYTLRPSIEVEYSLKRIVEIGGLEYRTFPLDLPHIAIEDMNQFADSIRSVLETKTDYFVRSAAAPLSSPVLRLDHIGVVSRYEKKMRALLPLLGALPAYDGIVQEIGVRCEYHALANVEIELVVPLQDNSIVSKHREKMPFHPLHHLAFEVQDLDEAVQYFRERGYAPVDGKILLAPKPFHRVIFLSPMQTAGLLIELVANEGRLFKVYGGSKEDVWQM